jgi:hypothetical protein
VKASEGKFSPRATPVVEKPKDGNTHYIGYGHNIGPTSEYMNKTISENEAERQLISDLVKAKTGA